jgi:hypothetical protein
MSLAPREQETLAAIENQVLATDPRFATMFRVLDALGPRSEGPLWVFLSVWVARRGKLAATVLLAVVVMVLTAAAAAGVILA